VTERGTKKGKLGTKEKISIGLDRKEKETGKGKENRDRKGNKVAAGIAPGKGCKIKKQRSSLGRYVFGSEISYNKPPPRLPGLAY
jgi:hypothetical protein